jgi:hypothetical protein
MSTLESNVIRHLILDAKLPSKAHDSTEIGNIVAAVFNMAVTDGFLHEVPSGHDESALEGKIIAVIWGLIIEGVYTPGLNMRQPHLPHLCLTEHGQTCFDAGELTAHDPDDYLHRLRVACPTIDEITLLYTGEALDTFRAGNHLASAVMIGVAAEKMLLQLVDSIRTALDTPQRETKFEKDTKGKGAKTQHVEALKILTLPTTRLPAQIGSVLAQHIDGIYDLIRRTRNDAGHPTGKRMERHETQALVLLFPTYCKTVHDLMEWLRTNKI